MENLVLKRGELVLYANEDGDVKIKVLMEGEAIWVTLKTMVDFFEIGGDVIGDHIKNVFESGELVEDSAVRHFPTTATKGDDYLTRYYSLSVLISVAYRVNNQRGIEFRKWAGNVVCEYDLKGFALDEERLKGNR